MSTATAPASPALKSVEAFRDDVSLFRCDFGDYSGPDTFVITCTDGALLWGHRLPETTDRQGRARTLSEIVADKVIVTHTGGAIEELICQHPSAKSGSVEKADQ